MSYPYHTNFRWPWKFLLLSTAVCLLQNVAAVKVFKANSLSTCMDGSSFAANRFYVTFTPNNNSITFDINGYSNETSNVVLDLEVLGYGYSVAHPIIHPCNSKDLAGLCPLNSGPLQIRGNADVPADAVKQIPTPIYYVPDIDVKVRLWINSTDTNKPMACVEASLGNEKTVHQEGVSWSIALLVLLSLVLSAIISGLGHSNTAAHLASNVLSLFGYFQAQAFIGMTAVKAPPIVRAWTQNFQWSMGIIRVKFLQRMATWYQRSTGGKPSTYLSSLATTSVLVQKRSLIERSNQGADDIQNMKFLTVTGIERVGFVANIEITNIFYTSYTFFVIFVLFTLIGVYLFKQICELLVRRGKIRQDRFQEFRVSWTNMLKGIFFRIILITFPQVAVLCFWEVTKRDSSAEVVLAITTVLWTMILLCFASIKVWKYARRSIGLYQNPAPMLYSDAQFLNKWGFLYIQFKAPMYFFFIPILLYTLLKSLFLALGQGSGTLQAVAFVALELVLLLAISILQPYMDKRTNGFNISIAVVNFLNAVLLLFYTGAFGIPALAIGIMGVLFFVLNVTFSLVIIVLSLWASISAIMSKNPETRYAPIQDNRASFIRSQNNLNTELDALGAIARGETPKGNPIDDKHDSRVGWNSSREFRGDPNYLNPNDAERRIFGMSEGRVHASTTSMSMRDSHTRLLPGHPQLSPPESGGVSPISRAHSPANWQRGVGF